MKNHLSPSHERALKRLGSNISLARRRRHWSQRAMAEQIGASVSTVRRLEAGDAGVAIQHLLGALAAFGMIDRFNALLDTPQDTIGLQVQDAALPERIRGRAEGEAVE
ncbi:helix-turn-helix domain-containing protein [Hydrogenophaga pseudoflava]|uniref:helix-turn-helix domain-containing protein n=1 Tax=Hydrogenophaga pseudoflava TaxID=47421 RepID=UPI0027E4922D|nr:helix-turn-helix transcriptional regulator [Hydrogenophaga pseudoflava]MDQ7747340.1 helix-turn-helix transcriptional regulator [Hydrogenophaga pseudoflava]